MPVGGGGGGDGWKEVREEEEKKDGITEKSGRTIFASSDSAHRMHVTWTPPPPR